MTHMTEMTDEKLTELSSVFQPTAEVAEQNGYVFVGFLLKVKETGDKADVAVFHPNGDIESIKAIHNVLSLYIATEEADQAGAIQE